MTRRERALLLGGCALLTLPLTRPSDAAAAAVAGVLPPVGSEAKPGGATTLAPGRTPGIAEPFANLSPEERFEIAVGRAFFRDPWVAAPATTSARDGLGPLFNAHACASCHPGGGRGALGEDGRATPALLLRLGRPAAPGGAPRPDPVYGDQLQTLGLGAGGAAAAAEAPVREGLVEVDYDGVAGGFADGTPFALRRPTWRIVDPGYGPLHPDVRIGARLAPSLRGVGLLEAIPEDAILARADAADRDHDGISGRPSRVAVTSSGATLGRFGWKATQPSLRRQVAAALGNDLGITSELHPLQPCTPAQEACRRAPSGADQPAGTEISPVLLDALTHFTATLAVPARARTTDPQMVSGRAAFHETGCAACHTPSFVTGGAASAAAGQTIWPYTDLLLHDMGPGLADEVGESDAGASEWRTPPLWGLGRAARGRQPAALLHDGRARSIEEAIVWHGGEAGASRTAFLDLPRRDRAALLAFLATL